MNMKKMGYPCYKATICSQLLICNTGRQDLFRVIQQTVPVLKLFYFR